MKLLRFGLACVGLLVGLTAIACLPVSASTASPVQLSSCTLVYANSALRVTPLAPGSCAITLRDGNGNTATVPITVNP